MAKTLPAVDVAIVGGGWTGRIQTCGEALAKCSQPKLEQKPQYTQALMCRPSLFT